MNNEYFIPAIRRKSRTCRFEGRLRLQDPQSLKRKGAPKDPVFSILKATAMSSLNDPPL